jgi:hypothetical protein
MIRMKVIGILAMALSPLCFAQAQNSPTTPPTWTDVMNSQTPCTTAACGNYFPLGGGSSPQYQTTLSGVPNRTLALTNVTLPTNTSFPWNCGGTNSSNGTNLSATAVTFIETYRGSGISGVGFLGTFTNTTPFTLTVTNPVTGQQQAANLFESVFFNENQCYGNNGVGAGDGPDANGREYGFVLASSTNTELFAYWGTMENVNTAQVNFPLIAANNMQTTGAATPVAGQEYYYEMYPFLTSDPPPANCGFQINIYTANNTVNPIFKATVPVNGGPTANQPESGIVTAPATSTAISGADSSFCSVIASTAGDIGFVSANIEPPSNAGGTLPSTGNLNLNLQRLFVGKN